MKNLKFTLLIALPVVLIAGAVGFFGFRYVAGAGMAPMNMADATTYESGPFRVTVDINPEAPQVGDNQFMVKVADAQGNPITGASIKAYGEMPAMGAMASMRAPADLDEVEPGLYAGPLNLEMRGEWPLSLYIQKDGVGETRLGFDMATGRQGLSITSGGTPVAGSMSQKDGMGGDQMAASQSPEKNDRGFYTVGQYQVKVEVLGSGGMVPGDAMSGDKMEPGARSKDGAIMRDDGMRGEDTMMADSGMSGDDRMMRDDAMSGEKSMRQRESMSPTMSDRDDQIEKDRMAMDGDDGMSGDTPEAMEAMKKGTAMMAGRNLLQVTVLDENDRPVNGATVRVAAQLEKGAGMQDQGAMMGNEASSGDRMMQDDAMSSNVPDRGDKMEKDRMAMDGGDRMRGDDAMMANQGMSGSDSMMRDDAMSKGMSGKGMQGQRNSEVVQLEAGGDGVYRGVLELPTEGDYVLAVDVTTEEQGHGDLVLAFTTGEYGLRAATATPEGIAYYTCSMHTSVRKSEPGQCPICSMDLVPVTNEQVQSGVVTVDARRRQLIGVRTGKAQMREVSKTIRAVGQVDYDERRISNISLKFDAWIGELKADYVGTRVEKGQVLFTVYSPELLSAQQEYLEARQRLASRGPDDSLVRAARKRLMLWDISPAQVRAIERRGEAYEYLPIHAPKSGTVVEKMINEGSHMKTGDMLLRIADLSTVWIDAEVYEADLPLIDKGMTAEVNLPYGPDKQYRAKVDYIYPYLEGKTRTARIRLVLDNPNGALKPDMYAEVKLQADLGRRLMVPEGAVLVAGESRVVFKDLGEDGKLKPVRVKTGQRVDGWVEIRQGLDPGDDVITSGNFLIAAEAKLKTGIEQW
ncbi:efflux RND transporter periplasmic adaptor subunit [Salinisphaera sp. P385]|uniref:Efflux RND transporter periplasmic adaptor subunit n=1 Tax=Spectribacter acetivorans TaxID=3075603 RepID=A0ABU3B837_9GAMM|nr:efflux RND transporter periplasmic adaptor subunit [Salinisphaera sp. P385]MDT0617458.1 efflux RND transporter periplasmic adaptor subunit [Salinisphaera sp. P385]